MDVLKELSEIKILPVVKIGDVKDAIPLCEALKRGGISAAEITFRTEAAAECIRVISENMPDFLVGAGTVLSAAQAKAAIDAGAGFAISPGFSDGAFDVCRERGVTYIPGCATPTEIMRAAELGIKTVKIFPAEVVGGVKFIRAVSAAFSDARFIPTGGINGENFTEYLKLGCVSAVGGSWIADERMTADKRFDEICRLAAGATNTLKEICDEDGCVR